MDRDCHCVQRLTYFYIASNITLSMASPKQACDICTSNRAHDSTTDNDISIIVGQISACKAFSRNLTFEKNINFLKRPSLTPRQTKIRPDKYKGAQSCKQKSSFGALIHFNWTHHIQQTHRNRNRNDIRNKTCYARYF